MKPLLLALALIPVCLFGQITLSVDDFSDGGDQVWISTMTNPTIDFSTTGPNSTWDYSSLVAQSQQNKTYVGSSDFPGFTTLLFGGFAPPQYQATNFTSSTALPLDQLTSTLPVNITDVNQFSKNSTDSITSVGFSVVVQGTAIPFRSDTIETRYKFPLNYGDSYSSRGYSNLDMNPVFNGIWRQYRQRSSTVDGWGSITTPYGTFDALRIDHLIEEFDSVYFDVQGTGTWIPIPVPNSHIYEWWTNGEKEPILRITTSDIVGVETVTAVEYKDNDLGLGVEELLPSVQIYPNPSEKELHIEGLQDVGTYTIVNVDGRQVQKGTISKEKSVIDIQGLVPGTYTFVVLSNKGLISETFIKK